MVVRTKGYPILENAIDLFGDWLKHRELRDMNTGDFARIAQDLCVSAAELEAVRRRGPHASDELPQLLQTLNTDEAALSRTQPVRQRDMVRVYASCRKRPCATSIAMPAPRLTL
jgi:hypothetical protein